MTCWAVSTFKLTSTNLYNKWIHARCSKVKGKLKDAKRYQCPKCAVVASPGGTVEAVVSAVVSRR